MNLPVRFAKAPKILAAVLELKGPYEGLGAGIMKLKAWMDGRGIVAAGGPFALFYDNPTETPETELRSDACLPVSKPFVSGGAFLFKEFPECEVAETRHSGRPEEYTSTYGAFLEQLLREGYSLDGPAREFFSSPSPGLRPGMGWLIQQPVSKKRNDDSI